MFAVGRGDEGTADVRVTGEALRVLAGDCDDLADQLTNDVATSCPGRLNQASATAVRICDERVSKANAALAAWTSASANALIASAEAYESVDVTAAGELNGTVL